MSAAALLWDTHAHVIGDPDRYPRAPGRGYDPDPASLDDYLSLLDRLGLDRGVLVQPSVYGFDNRCMLDALDAAAGRLVGIAVPSPDSTPRDLESLRSRGVVGVRCNLINPGGLKPDTVLGWQPALRELGWHVEVQLGIERIDDLRAWLDPFDVPVVVDHMGRPSPGRTDPGAPGPARLLEAVRDGGCRVKLSAPYRLSAEAPPWSDVAPLARALLDADAEACLWASDWPHTDTRARVRPDDLIKALAEWSPDLGERRALMARAGDVYETG